ncbi:MAG: metallophosphoesterase [Candidatus Marinimicrobia bacterium]|jgi:predicted phosphodiesterase|nr:metallophosphoesterase [Candidatus Neomarinimicrobiota bacterium]MDP6593469.1 metallophosphoesterase [Candidatus Neomarinimicrobiota bacterium]MDP6836934.1 metallophosphoesterase [Candidatus Neomarinimicrobiota bacterium]MDP6967285.1 metallophosphoesterase [Candidatus Neomarinimicrobiota bacterium]|tara:strand:+ start:69 stop:848 length:780 start_codon:yes stop_codon:yes gene_type:complete
MANKTFAILTDIHGNLAALEKALSIVSERDDVDETLYLGDYFSLGPAPKEILDILAPMENTVFICGNHERYLVERIWEQEFPTIEGMSPDDPVCQGIVQHERWAAEQIVDEGIDFIRNRTHVSYRDNIGSTLIEFSHAWYERDDQPPSLEEAITWRNHVRLRYPEVNLFVFLHGHIHVPREEQNGNLKILCQGSTGIPFDKITKGAIGFLTVGDEFKWEVQRFEYDMEATLDLLETRKPPFYQNLQSTLKHGEIRNDFL